MISNAARNPTRLPMTDNLQTTICDFESFVHFYSIVSDSISCVSDRLTVLIEKLSTTLTLVHIVIFIICVSNCGMCLPKRGDGEVAEVVW
jgi:hypothetical protein